MSNYAPDSGNSRATGGVPTQAPPAAPQSTGHGVPLMSSPDDSPMLLDPTQRPDEPITAGLESGLAGGQPAARSTNDMEVVKQYLPDLEEAANWDGAPPSFKMLVNMIRNS